MDVTNRLCREANFMKIMFYWFSKDNSNIKALFPRVSWWSDANVNTFGCPFTQFSKAESLLCLQKTHCFHLLIVWHALLWQWGFLSNRAGCIGNNKPHWLALTFCPLDTRCSHTVYVCEKLLSHQFLCTDISLFILINVSVGSSVLCRLFYWVGYSSYT